MNGQVVRGQGNTAGEFGHIPISLDGPSCLCGSHGCLEAYTSNIATLKRYLGRDLTADQTRDLLRTSGLTVNDVIARARDGERARRSPRSTRPRTTSASASPTIINALNPAQIIVGGEITAVWDRIAPIIHAEIAERALTVAASDDADHPGGRRSVSAPARGDGARDGTGLRGAAARLTRSSRAAHAAHAAHEPPASRAELPRRLTLSPRRKPGPTSSVA